MTQMNLSMKQKHTDMENRWTLAKKEWEWGRGGLEEWGEQTQTSVYRMDK